MAIDPQASTLFAIDLDSTLWVLSRDPNATAAGLAGVWSATQVIQQGVSAQDLSNWRTQITVLDANGVPVGGAEVNVAADRATAVWQSTGSTILSAGVAQKFPANAFGQVTLAVISEALEAPQYTVQLLDPNSNPTGNTVTEAPDSDVHNFLAGTAPLNSLGTLSATTLINATDPDNPSAALSSVIAAQPTTDGNGNNPQQQFAAAVVSGLNQTMKAGLSTGAPNSGDINSFMLDLTPMANGLLPTYSQTTATANVRTPTESGRWPFVGGRQFLVGRREERPPLHRALDPQRRDQARPGRRPVGRRRQRLGVQPSAWRSRTSACRSRSSPSTACTARSPRSMASCRPSPSTPTR